MRNFPEDSNELHWEATASAYVSTEGTEIQVTRYLHKPTGRLFYRSRCGSASFELFDMSKEQDGSLLSPGAAERYRPKA